MEFTGSKGSQMRRRENLSFLLVLPLVLTAFVGCTKIMSTIVLPIHSKLTLDIPDVSRDEVICFALYTVHKSVMKMTAQLYPLRDGEDRTVRLEVMRDGSWKEIARSPVIERGWTAHFRVENWDCSRDTQYRLAHGERAFYSGTVKKDPIHEDTIVVAAFTGNAIYGWTGGDIPKDDIVENIKRLDPDLLFFSGDQVYDHYRHYAYWLKFGREFGEVIRNTPTITIPDDHDVGQDNLWGATGKKSHARTGDDGGYAAEIDYVKMVERAQTSHLPDPYDPRPVQNGIGVYYTDITVGGVNFAIVEDRKFKSPPPKNVIPHQGDRPDHVVEPGYDPKMLDIEDAVLLGERQLRFLEDWAGDWHDCSMKAVLSQTVFASASHLSGDRDYRVYADLDSNGWPQSGRNRALERIRKAFAVMIAGDQHLATVIHHGVDAWQDSGYSFCVPSIANFHLRWWEPLVPGKNRQKGMPEYLGDFRDGFDNRIRMVAVANPAPEPNGDKLNARAAGFGIVKFKKSTREITFECWPRQVDITSPDESQYLGWPVTIRQEENYGRKATAFLPRLLVKGTVDPVVEVIDEKSNEMIYALRINGQSWDPRVFGNGTYTVKIRQGNREEVLRHVSSISRRGGHTRTVEL
jgi:phosphodiesterase/alkaline phosphatase D-like protein